MQEVFKRCKQQYRVVTVPHLRHRMCHLFSKTWHKIILGAIDFMMTNPTLFLTATTVQTLHPNFSTGQTFEY